MTRLSPFPSPREASGTRSAVDAASTNKQEEEAASVFKHTSGRCVRRRVGKSSDRERGLHFDEKERTRTQATQTSYLFTLFAVNR